MGVLRSYPSSNVSAMSHRVSQTLCQCVSLPHRSAAVGLLEEGKAESQDSGVGRWERVHFPSSALLHLHPLSGCHVLFASRGRLSGSGHGERVSLAPHPPPLPFSLGWTAGRTQERRAVVCAHMGAGEEERGSVMDRDRESQKGAESCAAQPRL